MNTKNLKVIFMGSPDFAVPCLQEIIDSEHEVIAAYCQPPRPAGRGQKLRKTPIHKLAEKYSIPVYYPDNLKNKIEQNEFKSHDADIAIVAAYGLILPQEILDAPKRGCINVHPSKLPRWRGAAPLQRTIMAGDKTTSLCIMQMAAGLDTGDILQQEDISIPDGMTAGELHDLMASRAGNAVLEVINNNPKAIPQVNKGITYASKISKSEARISWDKPAQEVRQHILGLSPFPAAFTEYNGEKIKILNAELSDKEGNAGETLNEELHIACKTGSIIITKAQRPGKRAMSSKDLLQGFSIPKGSNFA